jgi:hypothetical protein
MLSNEFVIVAQIGGSRVIRVTRTGKAFSNLNELRQTWGEVVSVLDGLDRPSYALLFDVRSVSGRNDPEFEHSFAPYRLSAQRGFRKVAVIVSTPFGQLQVGRYAQEDGVPVRAFTDPAEALAWADAG